jgi:hypothetical protein
MNLGVTACCFDIRVRGGVDGEGNVVANSAFIKCGLLANESKL